METIRTGHVGVRGGTEIRIVAPRNHPCFRNSQSVGLGIRIRDEFSEIVASQAGKVCWRFAFEPWSGRLGIMIDIAKYVLDRSRTFRTHKPPNFVGRFVAS